MEITRLYGYIGVICKLYGDNERTWKLLYSTLGLYRDNGRMETNI